MIGSRSYLKLIQVLSPFGSVIIRPLHSGLEISITTLTLKKLPPSSSATPVEFWTSPTISHKLSAALRVRKLTGMLCICTQKGTFTKLISCTGTSPAYLCITIKCLSKLHGWLLRILSTPSRLLNTNKTMLLPWLQILNPLFVRHNYLNVLATTSIWRKWEVNNFDAMMNLSMIFKKGIS